MYYKISICFVCLCLFNSCIKRVEKTPDYLETNITPPVLLKKVEPYYPVEARSMGIEGIVKLTLYVTESGNVSRVEVTSSSGYSKLDEAAQQYAKSLVFAPAIKDNESIGVWLSWVVHYNLLVEIPLFNMNDYINNIQELFETVKNSNIQERENLMSDILKTHENYFNYIRKNPEINLNIKLQSILSDEVSQQWQEYWSLWTLTFVVLQDFDLRYPETKLKAYAIDLQIKQIVEDLERVSKSSSEKKEKFYQAVYQYLKEKYPKSLENSRKEDLQIYLEY